MGEKPNNELTDKGYITLREGEPRTIRPIGYKLVKESEE